MARALAIQERVAGPRSLAVAASLARLAMLHVVRLDLPGAESLYRRALAIREAVLGRRHPGVARILDDLARLPAGAPGPHDGRTAERLLRRSLAIREASLGPNHPDVAISLYNLAENLAPRQENAAMADLYRRALRIRERAFCRDSLPVAEALILLDGALRTPRPHGFDSATLEQRALAIQERIFGPDSPRLLDRLNWIADAMEAGRWGANGEVEALRKRILAIEEKAAGPESEQVVKPIAELVRLYRDLGRPAEAKALAMRALAIKERLLVDPVRPLPIKPPGTFPELVASFDGEAKLDGAERLSGGPLDSLIESSYDYVVPTRKGPGYPALALAAEAEDLGEDAAAERLYQIELNRMRSLAKPRDEWTNHVLWSLARFYEKHGRFEDAETILKPAIANAEDTFVKSSGDSRDRGSFFEAVDELTTFYRLAGRPREAEPLNQRALALELHAADSSPRSVIDRYDRFAAVHVASGRPAEAAALLEAALRVADETGGPDHETMRLARMDRLAAFYDSQSRGAEAYALYWRAVEMTLPAYTNFALAQPFPAVYPGGPPQPPIVGRLERFAAFCRRQGRDAEADEFHARAIGLWAIELEQDLLNAGTVLSADVDARYAGERLVRLVAIYRDLGRSEDAERTAARLLQLWETGYGPDNPRVASALTMLADFHDARGRRDLAAPLRTRAAAIVDEADRRRASRATLGHQ
jgi:tetratricopeptide (TPR) repeat protein